MDNQKEIEKQDKMLEMLIGNKNNIASILSVISDESTLFLAPKECLDESEHKESVKMEENLQYNQYLEAVQTSVGDKNKFAGDNMFWCNLKAIQDLSNEQDYSQEMLQKKTLPMTNYPRNWRNR